MSTRTRVTVSAIAAVTLLSLFAYFQSNELPEFLVPLPADTLDELLASSGDRAELVPPVLSSPNEDSERGLFTDVLALQHADILVVPVNAPGATSADRAGRSLMTRRLADAIAERTGLAVADPGLVQRALGVHRRTFEAARIDELARSMGARLVVTGEVSPDPDAPGTAFRLKLRVNGSGALQEGTWSNLVPTDVQPVDEMFRTLLADVLVKLSFSLSVPTVRPPLARDPLEASLPARPFDLVERATSPLENALRLQLFAALHPRSDIHGTLLWERSLEALDRVASDLPAYRLLHARALFHLGRRPAARAVLDHPQSDADRAFLAVLQGNLAEAEAATADIAEPALQLLAALEAVDIREDYGLGGPSALLAEMRRTHPGYALLLEGRDSQPGFGTEEMAPRIANELQHHSVVVNDGTRGLGSVLRAAFGDDRFDLARGIEATRASQWKAHAREWGVWGLGASLTPADYFDLLRALNRAAVMATVRADCGDPARSRQAARAREAIKAAFDADAQWNLLEADCRDRRDRMGVDRKPDSRSREIIRRLARDAYVWEGGESELTARAREGMGDKRRVAYRDEPPHQARRMLAGDAQQRDEVLRGSQRRLQYVNTDFSAVEDLERDLREAGRGDELVRLLTEMEGRFHGSPRRAAWFARLARDRGDLAEQERIFRDGMAANPEDWNHREQLARVLLLEHRPREAAAVLQSFPGFRDLEWDSVTRRLVATHAQRAAHELLDAGEAELALPFLEWGMKLDPEGPAGVWSAEMQAFLRGDIRDAARFAETQMREYNSEAGATRAMDYAFLLDDDTHAWKLYEEAGRQDQWTLPRWGAVFGNWASGGSERELFEKALTRTQAGSSREHVVFMTLFLDKLPSDEAMEMLRQVGTKRDEFSFFQVAAGIRAFRHHDFGALIKLWSPLQDRLSIVSARQDRSLTYTLPYLALAHWSTGTLESFRGSIDAYSHRFPHDFDTLLARAVVAAAEAKPDQALELFWQAFIENPGATQRPVPTELMLLDILEGVYEQTRNARYRSAIVDFARRMQSSWPTSFYYAYEAKYAPSEQERLRALGIALHLDRNSAHLGQFSEEERERARQWFGQHQPFSGRSSQ